MFKSFQDTSALQQFNGFPNLNMQQATSAYGFSGVTTWLDAAYGLNTQTDLGAVSRWQARVGIEIFEQATAGNQPRLVLSDINFNNLPTVQFFDTARRMDFAQGIGISARNFTIVFIAKYDTLNAINALISNSAASGTLGLGGSSSVGFNPINGIVLTSAGDTVANLNGTTESTTTKIVAITNTELVVNGIQEATNAGFQFDWSMNRLGQRGTGSTTQLLGRIAEIIVFANNKLTSAQLVNISNNINQKYAIY